MEVKKFFEEKFREKCCPRPRLDGASFKSIKEEEALSLEASFDE